MLDNSNLESASAEEFIAPSSDSRGIIIILEFVMDRTVSVNALRYKGSTIFFESTSKYIKALSAKIKLKYYFKILATPALELYFKTGRAAPIICGTPKVSF